MQDSVRDAFMVALTLNGYSMNSTNPDELNAARDSLIAQKPLVQAYVIDQVLSLIQIFLSIKHLLASIPGYLMENHAVRPVSYTHLFP